MPSASTCLLGDRDRPIAAELPRLAFVHIPKTAGSSVTNRLMRAYGPLTFPGLTTLDFACYSDDELGPYRFFRGHAYRRDYRRLPTDTFRFTILRNPIARAISCYKYFRNIDTSTIDQYGAEAVEIARRGNIVDFVRSASPVVVEHLRLGQLRQFLSEETLAEIGHEPAMSIALKRRVAAEFLSEIGTFDYVMTCEGLGRSFPKLTQLLGLDLPPSPLPRDNVSAPVAIDCLADVARAVVAATDVEFRCYNLIRRRESAQVNGLHPRSARTPN